MSTGLGSTSYRNLGRFSVRILAVADIHGVRNVYEWLARQAKEQRADVVVAAGDLSAGSWSDEEQRQEAQAIIAGMKNFAVTTLYLMGNDDFFPLDYEDKQLKPLHGRRVELGGYGFVGYQYSTPFVGSIHEKHEQEIEKDLRELEPLLDERTVFVTHSPMFGVLDGTYSGERVGSRSLASLLDRRPVLAHIHGHIHDSFGREGNHFNVAAAGQRRAVVIDLASLNHKVLQDG